MNRNESNFPLFNLGSSNDGSYTSTSNVLIGFITEVFHVFF